MNLRGSIAALHEPRENDGYPELESIPHAFAVEFVKHKSEDKGMTWSIFCDTEDDRVRLLSLFVRSAGLHI